MKQDEESLYTSVEDDYFKLELYTNNYEGEDLTIFTELTYIGENNENLSYLSYIYYVYDDKGKLINFKIPTYETDEVTDMYGPISKNTKMAFDLNTQIADLESGVYSISVKIELDIDYSNQDGSPKYFTYETEKITVKVK